MPIERCSSEGQPGFKWGDSGKCYLYNPESEESRISARKKALSQGIAIGDIDIKGVKKELDEMKTVTASGMGSGIKNPEQGAGGRYRSKKPRILNEEELDHLLKSLKEWFRENWVDLSRPKPGGGFEPCGRSDASTGKYPKCVPASRAARMTPEEIASAVRRKRRAESTQTRDGKKPIYVSTEKAATNVPTNPALYARVKAEAKRKFNVYPSAYANAWLVREYKKRGGGYRTVNKQEEVSKVAPDLSEEEAALADAITQVAEKYGKFDDGDTGIWIEYESADENDDKEIGVHCMNCVLYEGEGVCKILKMQVEDFGKCRFALIPDGVVVPEMEDDEEEDDDNEDAMSALISIIRNLITEQGGSNELQ